MDIDCPKCGHTAEINGENLPDHACDDAEYECKKCGLEMLIGWYATAEVRGELVKTD